MIADPPRDKIFFIRPSSADGKGEEGKWMPRLDPLRRILIYRLSLG